MRSARIITSILTLALAAGSLLLAGEAPKAPDLVAQVQALCEQALATARDDPAGAMALVDKAAALAAKDKSRPSEAVVALNAASHKAQRADLIDIAERLAMSALAIAEKQGPDSLDAAWSFDNLGGVAWGRGDLDAAQDWFKRALAIREKLAPGTLDLASSLNNLGVVANNRGQVDAALDYHERALAIREKLAPDTLDLASSLSNLNLVAMQRGDVDAAWGYAQRALAIEEKLAPGSLDVAETFTDLGVIANVRGDLDAAQDYHQRSLAIEEKLVPGSFDVASALTGLGNVAVNRGDLDAARDYFQRALDVQEAIAPGLLESANSLNNLGVVEVARGDFDAARDYFQRALAIKEQIAPGSVGVALSLNNLGTVARSRGEYDVARDYDQRALAIQEKRAPDSPGVAVSLNNLGVAAHDRGDFGAARDHYERALDLWQKLAPGSLEVSTGLFNLGSVSTDQGDLDAGRDFYQRSLEIRERLAPESLSVAQSLGGLGDVLYQQGRLAESEEARARAWAIVREQRRAVAGDEAGRAFGAMLADIPVKLARTRLAQGKTAAAFQSLEEGRAQGLLTLMSERGLSGAGRDKELWRKYLMAESAYQNAGQALAAAGEKDHDAALSAYTQARLTQDRLLGEIRRSLPGLEPRAFTFDEARRVLPKGSVFLAWMMGQEDSALFVIPADPKRAIEAHAIPLSETQVAERVGALRRLIDEGRRPLGAGGPAGSQQPTEIDPALLAASRDMYETLLPPEARAAVDKADRVIVSPDGPLWELPFAALLTNVSGAPRWLGLRKKLSYAPSLTILALERERARPASAAAGDVLVVGNPIFTRTTPTVQAANAAPVQVASGERSSLIPNGVPPPPLPGSGDEARQIAALYGAEPLLGEAATEAAVRQKISGASVVHLATHGYFHPYLAMSSGVLLTPPAVAPAIGETDNDGALQAWEFGRTLPLRAELVVLSACETGRGEKVRGEGLVGLTRAIQAAGARSVVATQWSVPDKSTAALMVGFHERLRDGLPKDEALRRALAETAANPATRHPYYWGAFFLTGDPDQPLKAVGNERGAEVRRK